MNPEEIAMAFTKHRVQPGGLKNMKRADIIKIGFETVGPKIIIHEYILNKGM